MRGSICVNVCLMICVLAVFATDAVRKLMRLICFQLLIFAFRFIFPKATKSNK